VTVAGIRRRRNWSRIHNPERKQGLLTLRRSVNPPPSDDCSAGCQLQLDR
jgi:hypothetical protein